MTDEILKLARECGIIYRKAREAPSFRAGRMSKSIVDGLTEELLEDKK